MRVRYRVPYFREVALKHRRLTNSELHAFTPREHARLIAILARLASPFECERAAAGLLATAFISKYDLFWSDLLIPSRHASYLSPLVKQPCQNQDRRRDGSSWRPAYCRRQFARRGLILNLAL